MGEGRQGGGGGMGEGGVDGGGDKGRGRGMKRIPHGIPHPGGCTVRIQAGVPNALPARSRRWG